MRDILFRGKILGLTDWSYGYYAKSGENHFILLDTDNEDNYSIVDPETVGQYTGFTDKNGKRIFEGDIVQFDYVDDDGNDAVEDFLISYKKGAFFARQLGNIKCPSNILHIKQRHVIGNKWDNPELLEMKK